MNNCVRCAGRCRIGSDHGGGVVPAIAVGSVDVAMCVNCAVACRLKYEARYAGAAEQIDRMGVRAFDDAGLVELVLECRVPTIDVAALDFHEVAAGWHLPVPAKWS